MILRRCAAFIMITAFVLTLPGAGLTATNGRLEQAMSKRLDAVEFPNMDVVTALEYLAEEAGLNIAVSKAVTGRCRLSLKNIMIKDVFDIILLTNDLAYAEKGDILYVMTAQEYSSLYGTAYSDTRKVRTFRLQYASPEKAFNLIDALRSDIGKVVVDEASGTVVLTDTPEKLEEIAKALEVLEKEVSLEVFDINYAKAKDIEEKLKSELDEGQVGTVVANEETNQVMVKTLNRRMEDVKRIISALDKKTPQVLIDAKIIQIRLRDNFNAEIKWEGIFNSLNGLDFLSSHPFQSVVRQNRTFIGDYTEIAPDENPPPASKFLPGERVFFGEVGSNDAFEGMISFLRTLGDVKILSNPKVAVVDRQEARILIGRREPYITTTTAQAQSTTTVAEDIQFIDVGIKLSVTPNINREGYITMQIKPEISTLQESLTTPSGNVVPIVNTSEAETTVMVKDDATILIGGLRKDEEVTTTERVPFFSKIPLFGLLFRSHKSERIRSELLVMITPHLVTGDVLEMGDSFALGKGLKPYVDYEGDLEVIDIDAGPVDDKLEFKPANGSTEEN